MYAFRHSTERSLSECTLVISLLAMLGGGDAQRPAVAGLTPLRFCHENEQARLFFRVSTFSAARSCRRAAGVSQFDAAAAFDMGDRLRRRSDCLDIVRISAASRALSSRAGALANPRSPSSIATRLIGTPAWASVVVGLVAFASPSWAALGFDLAPRRRRALLPATFGTSSSITRPTIGSRGGIPIFTGHGCATPATTIFLIAEISA